MGMNNLPRVVTRPGIEHTSPRPLDRKSDALTVTPPSHQKTEWCRQDQNLKTKTKTKTLELDSMMESKTDDSRL